MVQLHQEEAPARNRKLKVQNAEPLHLALSHFQILNNRHQPLCSSRMRAFSMKGEPMNNETRKTASTPAAASPLTVKEAPQPVMVKKIGKTTYRVKIHFSETSKETMSDKIKRLILNDSEKSS